MVDFAEQLLVILLPKQRANVCSLQSEQLAWCHVKYGSLTE